MRNIINKKIAKVIIGFGILLLLALIVNGYPIYQFYKNEIIFTGPNDGISQMLPFQMYIFEQYTSGNFFYSTDFGLGGDFYSDLAYYYSTSVIFMLNIIGVSLINIIHPLNTGDIKFWAENAIYISVFKSMLIIGFTYLYFRIIKMGHLTSVLGGLLFASSSLYYRFTTHWSFFSDVFIWLPILLIAIELFFRKKQYWPIILIVALSLINNFYFGYYQAITGIFYFVIRIFYKQKDDLKISKKDYMKFICSTILGFGISLFAFFYSARSFINNERPKYNVDVGLFNPFNVHANIFYDNYLIVILFVAIQAIFTISLYKYRFYKMFSIVTITLMLLSVTSLPDIFFNGFSAPQKRWHYLLAFFSSGLIVQYVQYFKEIKIKTYIISLIPTLVILIIGWMVANYFTVWLLMFPIISGIGYLILITNKEKLRNGLYIALIISIGILSILVAYVNTDKQIYHDDHRKRASLYYLNSSVYDSGLQKYYINEMNRNKKDEERIGWRVLSQDNSPLYQGYKGMSIYSSIFDKQWVDFYYRKMKVNLPHESVSRYTLFQDRSNIYSLFSTKYFMKKSYDQGHPTNFEKIKADGKYDIYENKMQLPAVKVTHKYYDDEKLNTPIDREHAMIDGAITDKGTEKINESKNMLNHAEITYKNIAKKNGKYEFMPHNEIKIHLNNDIKSNENYYLSMYIDRKSVESNFKVFVNDYQNLRLFESSKYRTHENNLSYNTKPDKNGDIIVRVTPGVYKFKLQELHKEDYEYLKSGIKQYPKNQYTYNETKNDIQIRLKEHKSGKAIVNIPYKKGLTAEVDGVKRKVERVNYVMTGIDVKSNEHHIVLKYFPPYFKIIVSISIISLILSIVFCTKLGGKLKSFINK